MSNTVNVKRGRGRPSIFADKVKLVNALFHPRELSYPSIMKLVNKGLLEPVSVPHDGRGRPSHDYVLSGKAKSMLALRQYADAVKQVA